ncbi:hypothetical protein EVAR_2512_1 [Eumeta japonica]|uniref:Uncharacterized protein n=1 Tax=Eumeta variegata TaxID=151549 RepID=A0A4C1SRF4_EUMVA|nr:hypothetical protein EVAR_2512_1 [Eumeta japonica]
MLTSKGPTVVSLCLSSADNEAVNDEAILPASGNIATSSGDHGLPLSGSRSSPWRERQHKGNAMRHLYDGVTRDEDKSAVAGRHRQWRLGDEFARQMAAWDATPRPLTR